RRPPDLVQPPRRPVRPGERLARRTRPCDPGQQLAPGGDRPPGGVPQQRGTEPAPLPPRAHRQVEEAEVPVVPVRQLEQVPPADPGRVLQQPGLPRVTHEAGLEPSQENPRRHERHPRVVRLPGGPVDLVTGLNPPPVPSPEPLNAHTPSEPHPPGSPPPNICPVPAGSRPLRPVPAGSRP